MGIQLTDKVLLVTGAGSGIGQATALLGARAGAKVAVVDLNLESANKTIAMIKQAGGEGVAVKADISQAADVENMVQQTIRAFGKLDCAVNNAGVQGQILDTAECSEENWDRINSVNLRGTFMCLKHEVQQMLKQDGGGRVVNVASNMGLAGFPGMAAYSAAKHGVIGLTKSAALEYAARNIFINAVCPGGTQTGMVDFVAREQPAAVDRLMKSCASMMIMGRLAQPEEVAEAIIFCVSDHAKYMVGSVISVDGGFVAI